MFSDQTGRKIETVTLSYINAPELHSQCMTKIQVGHGDKSWSNLSRLRFDQDFTSWPRFDQHFTKDGLGIDQDMTNRLVKSYPKST